MNLLLAFRLFFAVLFNKERATQGRQLLKGPPEQKRAAEKPKSAPVPATPAAAKGRDALLLLAALQREARFLDMVQEPLADYSDEQVGAAARDVLSNCRKVIERMFAPTAVLQAEEGDSVEVPQGFNANEIRLTGNVAGEAPFKGTLVHHGWSASRCELPQLTGIEKSATVLAPAEVELQ